MAEQPHFIFGYLPFWIVTYGTAFVAWSCVGRFLLELVIAPDSPQYRTNYILRWFRLFTDWAILPVAFITPRILINRYLPLITFFWFFVLRFVLSTILLQYDMVPRLSGGG
jgi:hypothetical protein